MKKSMSLDRARLIFSSSIFLLSILGFLNRWLVCRYPFQIALFQFTVPVLIGITAYKLEYQHRFMEKIFMKLKKGKVFYAILPILFGSFAVILHHQDTFLGIYLPICFLISVSAAEAETHDRFDQLLCAVLIQCVVFFSLSLYLTYNAASAVSIIILSYIILFRLLAYNTHNKRDFWVGLFAMTSVFIFISAFIPDILDRLIFLAVSETDANVYSACMELWDIAKWCGAADFTLNSSTDLFLNYDLAYLVAKLGWVSIIPVLLALVTMLISGAYLCSGLRRPITTLAVGSYFLIVMKIVSYFAKSISITVGLANGMSFFSGGMLERIVDVLLAVIVLQPLNPKSLLELTPQDPDFDMQETAALILLPDNQDGAAQLAHYVFNTDNCVAWTVLIRHYLKYFGVNDVRILLINAADIFHTEEYLRKIKPEYYELTSEQEGLPVSDELKTACPDNTYIDASYTYECDGTTLLRYWGSKEILCIPPFFRELADWAFYQKEVELVSVPCIVQKIGVSCFRNCQELRCVELRNGCEEIEAFCFCDCTSLEQLVLPSSLISIGNDAFAGSGLTQITVPASVSVISPYTFARTPLKKVTLLGTTRIEEGAFKDCTQLTSVCLPDSLEYVAPNAFDGCSNTIEIIASTEWKVHHPDLIHHITKYCKTAAYQEVSS